MDENTNPIPNKDNEDNKDKELETNDVSSFGDARHSGPLQIPSISGSGNPENSVEKESVDLSKSEKDSSEKKDDENNKENVSAIETKEQNKTEEKLAKAPEIVITEDEAHEKLLKDLEEEKEKKKLIRKSDKEEFEREQATNTSPGILLKWFLVLGGGLIGVFYILLLWGLLSGDVSNPLFETLGIQAGELKVTILSLTNVIFGILSLIFLIATLVKFFQWIIVGKSAENRKEYIIKAGIFFGVSAIIFGIWVGIYWVITNTKAEGSAKFNQSIIQTQPQNVIGLTAPIKIEFNVGNKLFQQIDRELIRQISWDFNGDGEIDASGPSVVYRFVDKGENNGRYMVNVTVEYYSPSNKAEKSFVLKREVIISNEEVLASFKASPESGPVPLEVNFSAVDSKDPDGEIILYEWDLDNDGIYEIRGEDKVETSRVFSKVGEFKVKLKVTGRNNDTAETEKIITVGVSKENLKADIASDKGFEGIAPFQITIDGSQSFTRFGKIIKYEWFVQGEKETFIGRKIHRTFREPGEYKVSLTVENDLGEKDKLTKVIKVTNIQKDAKIDIRTTPASDKEGILRGIAPFEVAFDPSASTIINAVEWEWDYENDGIPDAFSKVAKTIFRKPGEYDVKLTIIDAAEKEYEKIQKVIVGRSGTQAKVTATPTSGVVPLTVEFDASSSTTDKGEIVDYTWEFPNQDPIKYGAKLSYEFRSVGTFRVNLKVMTSLGEIGETSTLISVRSHPLKAQFEVFPDFDNSLKLKFDPSSSTGTIKEYFWNFGDGSVSREFQPTHTYGFSGEYTVSLKVIDVKGVVSTTTETIQITDDSEE